MKIAALSPLFVVESPPAEETAEAERIALQLLDQSTAAPEVQEDLGRTLDDDTRAGLKRLSLLIDEKRRDRSGKPKIKDRKKRDAFARYQMVQDLSDARTDLGKKIDQVA